MALEGRLPVFGTIWGHLNLLGREESFMGAILVGTDGHEHYIYHTTAHPYFRRKEVRAELWSGGRHRQ